MQTESFCLALPLPSSHLGAFSGISEEGSVEAGLVTAKQMRKLREML